MPVPTETALKGRARTLLEAMTDRARWMYAVPRDGGEMAIVRQIVEEAGLRLEDSDDSVSVSRFATSDDKSAIVLFDSPDLEVLFLEGTGPRAPEVLATVLDKTGFYAQSQLLKTALDVREAEASKALRTLAHMVVAWDEDWSDLFLLHLASPDPVVRHDATLALTVATLVAGSPGPALTLLDEALAREKFPKLRDTMSEAKQVISITSGGPAEATP